MWRTQSSVASLLILIGAIALNIAGAIAVFSHDPRRNDEPGGIGMHNSIITRDGAGNTFFYRGNDFPRKGEPGDFRLVRVDKRPPPPTLFQIWSPLVATAATTMLIFAVGPNTRPRATSRRGDSGEPTPAAPPPRFGKGRLRMIVMALVALIVAGVSFTPPPVQSEESEPDFARICPECVTVVYGVGGGIIGYKGVRSDAPATEPSRIVPGSGGEPAPGETRGRAVTIRPPTRLWLELWLLPITCFVIATTAVVVMLRRTFSSTSEPAGLEAVPNPS
jgi:hypothetical protein